MKVQIGDKVRVTTIWHVVGICETGPYIELLAEWARNYAHNRITFPPSEVEPIPQDDVSGEPT